MLKVSTVILAVMLAFAAIYSVLVITVPIMMGNSGYRAVTGQDLDSVQDASQLKSWIVQTRHMGLFALTTTIAGLFILFAAFRKTQKWSWCGMLIVGGLAWGWGVVESAMIGNIFDLIMQLVGIVLLLIGLLIPLKSFFGRAS